MIGLSPIGVAPIGVTGSAPATGSASAPGASLAAVSSFSGGSAVGQVVAIALGAALVATSSMTGGSATGNSAGVASGAQLVATSSMAGGAASGTRSGIASGASLVAASSMSGGAASGGAGDGSTSPPLVVAASRVAKFAANPRVAIFSTNRPIALTKGALDELYFVGNFGRDLAESGTTAASVAPVSAGVAVLEGPVLQGALGVVKLGALDGGSSYFTFRVTCANGEQFDRTITLTAADDRSWVFGKDPDDRRFYALDFAADLALSANTTLASVGTPAVEGVSALTVPAIQGAQVVIKFGGLATASGAVNSCGLMATFANGEKIYRSIYFSREDH